MKELTIGKRLTAYRERSAVTLPELCKRLEKIGKPIDYVKLWRTEADLRSPTAEDIGALKLAMPGINLDGLLTGKTDPLLDEMLMLKEYVNDAQVRVILAGLEAVRKEIQKTAS